MVTQPLRGDSRIVDPDAARIWQALYPFIIKRALAQRVGVHSTAVGMWKRVPVEHLSVVSRTLHIPRHVLRPDLYRDRDDTAEQFRAVPLDVDAHDGEWGLERVRYPGILVASGMTRKDSHLWASRINDNFYSPEDIPQEYQFTE